MSTKTSITNAVPTAAHSQAAAALGRSAAATIVTAGNAFTDVASALTQCIKDMSTGTPFTLSTAAVVAGGTGYAANDTLTLANGVVLRVTTVSSGAITAVSIVAAGSLSDAVPPSGPQAQLSTSGSGGGATFTTNWTSTDPNAATFLAALAAVS